MNYYDLTNEQQQEIGADYDFCACIEYNPPTLFQFDDVKKVLAVVEGEHDGRAYHWVFSTKDGRFIYMTGSCDYTGWDCQSWATSVEITRNFSVKDAVDKLYSEYNDDKDAVLLKLMYQLQHGRGKTWREAKDKQFGIR